ncbi:hypothetical protein [Embleya sp. MST-111070]|uniref:hypothetical protein n=1 Tax=Embleya sp. MST-111070 TaxID=3398231 RepID=UPI003F73E6AC
MYTGEFPARHRDVVVAALGDAFGRDGLTPISHVDVDLRLDAADPQIGTSLHWAGTPLAATAPDSPDARLLGGTTVVTGAESVKGRGTAKRIAWEPGTRRGRSPGLTDAGPRSHLRPAHVDRARTS